MPRQIEIFHIDAFTSEPFKGNPAAVVFDNSLNVNEMQCIAAEMNLSETAFLSDSEKADYDLRWFTPKSEVDLCGHATIASLHFLYEKNLIKEYSQITFNTKSGVVSAGKLDEHYFMQLPFINFSKAEFSLNNLYDALAINFNQIKYEAFLSSNRYLYISVDNLRTLFNLKPDFIRLTEIISSQNIFSDIAVYTMQTVAKDSIAHLRFFAPVEGILEDPVTGSAAGPLLKLLKNLNLIENFSDDKIYKIEQGDILNRTGRIGVSLNESKKELKIYGKAVTVLKGSILI
ncbi:PhzF family phenazine biosynthesis protein [Ignavibacterium sp.]|uniref:PhzF family phenazine biosynthesis protein n=1 Tax=Ignavibacterium sp. TaxID=2651167 RepID=UPI00307F952F